MLIKWPSWMQHISFSGMDGSPPQNIQGVCGNSYNGASPVVRLLLNRYRQLISVADLDTVGT